VWYKLTKMLSKHKCHIYMSTQSLQVLFRKKPSPNAFNVWLDFLNQKVGGKVLFDCFLGKGFFMLKSNGPVMVKKLLMLTPFKTC
jgi:hypothetical protein